MRYFYVAGIDPSLRNWGMVKGSLDIPNEFKFSLDQMLLHETKPSKSKVVRRNSDDLACAQSIHKTMVDFLHDVKMVFVEMPIGSQSARAMANYGICVGLIASLTIPVIQVMPNEVKLFISGSNSASKSDIISWCLDQYPNANWLTNNYKGEVRHSNKNEHLADAVAVVHAGILTNEFQQAMCLMNLKTTTKEN